MLSPVTYTMYYNVPLPPIEMKVIKRTIKKTIKMKEYQIELNKMNEMKLITEYFT